jgi:hypothetical protein
MIIPEKQLQNECTNMAEAWQDHSEAANNTIDVRG